MTTWTATAVTFEGIELQLETDGDFGTRGDTRHFDCKEDAIFAAEQAAKRYDAIVRVYASEDEEEQQA